MSKPCLDLSEILNTRCFWLHLLLRGASAGRDRAAPAQDGAETRAGLYRKEDEEERALAVTEDMFSAG